MFNRKTVALITFMLLYGGCSRPDHYYEPHCNVQAYSVNSLGGRQLMDSWGNCTKPEKQPDGTFKFYNHYAETYITCPAGTEFIVEEYKN